MPTEAVSQAAVVPHTPTTADDVEAALATASDQGEDASAPVEIEAEQEQETAGRASTNNRRQLADFPFFALGFAAVVCLVLIIGDLLNGHTVRPITAGVFLLSSSYCIAIIRREWSATAGAAGAAGDSGQPGVLTKEARESLLTYFVFEEPMVEGAVAVGGSAERKAEQEQERADGKDLPSAAITVVEEMSPGGGSGGRERQRREDGGRKSGQENGGLDSSGSGSNSCGMRDDRAGTDATNADSTDSTASTPAASPGPSSPAPLVTLQEQPRIEGRDGGGGGGNAADTATAAAVARIGVDQLDVKDRREGEGEARRIQGSAPFDGLGLELDVVTDVEANNGASSAPRTVPGDGDGDGAGNAAPDTPETTAEPGEETGEAVAAAAATTAPAQAVDAMKAIKGASASGSASDSGAWSTDQSCIVCFGDYCHGDLLCRLPCRHVYHAKCIDEWLDRARTPCCPLCKTDLLAGRTDDGNGNGNTNSNGNGTAASGSGDSGWAATAASGAGVAEVELTGENAV